jgi:hypothetical protein
VSATLTLSGYTVQTFGTAQAAQFAVAVGARAGVPASSVTITSVTSAPSQRRRVHAAGAGVAVAFTVQSAGGSAAAVVAAVQAVTVASLQAAGLTECTSLAVVGTPSTGSTAPVVTTSLPPTTAPPAAGGVPTSPSSSATRPGLATALCGGALLAVVALAAV